VSIEQWAVVAGVVVVVAAAVPVWRHRRTGRRRRIPRFEGKLGHHTRNSEFVDFLTKNRHRRVRVDVWMDDRLDEAAATGADRSSPEQIRLVAPNDNPSLGDECEITIRVDDSRNSPLSHAHGVWRLDGYVVVEGLKGVWQGVPSYHLVAVTVPQRAAAE
jgi:hypothetical protein